LVAGSSQLVDLLIQDQLIDEYRMMVFPIILRSVKRLFKDGITSISLQLLEAKPVGSEGVIVITYKQKEKIVKNRMNKVISKAGTEIAYDKQGQGPAVILVDGALSFRSFGPMPELAKLLSTNFTVVDYDRRAEGAAVTLNPLRLNVKSRISRH